MKRCGAVQLRALVNPGLCLGAVRCFRATTLLQISRARMGREAMIIECPGCRHRLRLKDGVEARSIVCPSCGRRVEVRKPVERPDHEREMGQSRISRMYRYLAEHRRFLRQGLVVLWMLAVLGMLGVIVWEGRALAVRLPRAEHYVRSIASDVSSIKSDVSSIKSDVSSIESDVSSIQKNVWSIDYDITRMKNDVSSIESDVSSIESDVSSIESDVSSIEGDVSSIETDVTAIETAVTNMDILGVNTKR